MSWSAPDAPEQCCTGLATSISHMCAQPKTSLKPAQTEPSSVPGKHQVQLEQSYPKASLGIAPSIWQPVANSFPDPGWCL